MLGRTGNSEPPKMRNAMRRFLPFAALALVLGTVAGPLVGEGIASAAVPAATTSAATSVTGTSATLNGTVNAENNNPTTVSFCYSTSSARKLLRRHHRDRLRIPRCSEARTTRRRGSLSGLTPNTEYFFQIKAVGGGNTSMARCSTSPPRWHPPPRRVRPAEPTPRCRPSTAPSTLELLDDSQFLLQHLDFTSCSGATTLSASPATVTGATATTETGALSGLTPNTKYFFQIKATNSFGTTYGTVLNFTTSTAAPGAITNAASSVSGTAATLNGTVSANGPTATVTFCYSTTRSTNCSGTTSVNASPNTTSGRPPLRRRPSPVSRPTPSTSSRSRRSTPSAPPMARCQLHDHVGPDRHHQRGQRDHRAAATLNGSVNAENLSTTVISVTARPAHQLFGRHRGGGQPRHGPGASNTPRASRSPARSRHPVLLPDRGHQQRHHHLRLGTQLHHGHHRSVGHHQRGDQCQRHRGDPQRLGQRQRRLDHGHLLLRHYQLPQLFGNRTSVNASPNTTYGVCCMPRRRPSPVSRPTPSTSSRSRRPTASTPPTARCSTSRPRWRRRPPPARHGTSTRARPSTDRSTPRTSRRR